VKQISVWADMNSEGLWGVECDDPDLTFDGHYICVIPHKDPEDGRRIAEAIVAYMQGKKQARRTRCR